MKYLLNVTVKYRVDSVEAAEALHEQMKKDKHYTLTDFGYKTKYVKQKGEIIDEYQVVTAKQEFNVEKEPDNCLAEIYYSDNNDKKENNGVSF